MQKIKKCTIIFLELSGKTFKALPTPFHFSSEAYFRLKLPSLLANIDKILYLDSDMIILKDLAAVFKTELDNFYAAMVPDIEMGKHWAFNAGRLVLPVGWRCFNSGFTIFNLKKMRDDGIEKKLFSWANKNKFRIMAVDQDVLNVVLKGSIKELPEEYNVQMHYYYKKNNKDKLSKFKEKPYVIHFSGPKKPWGEKKMLLAEYFWNYEKKVNKL